MCSDEQHKEKMEALARIEKALGDIRQNTAIDTPIDQIYMVSATTPYTIDAKGKRHLFLWSATTLTLTLEDLGQITLTQYVWLNATFMQGLRVFASGQTANAAILARCTNDDAA